MPRIFGQTQIYPNIIMLAIDLMKCTNSFQLFWCLTPHIFPLYPHCGRANHPALREFRSGAFQLNPHSWMTWWFPWCRSASTEEVRRCVQLVFECICWSFEDSQASILRVIILAISCYLLYLWWDRERFFFSISRAGALGHVVHFVMLWAARAVALDTNGCPTYGDPI